MSIMWRVKAVSRDKMTGEIISEGKEKVVPGIKVMKDLEKSPGCWVVLDQNVEEPNYGKFIYGGGGTSSGEIQKRSPLQPPIQVHPKGAR